MGASQYCYFGNQYIQILYENFISGNLLICKLVHTSRGNN